MKARDKKCLCLDVRNLLGSHNLKIPRANKRDPGVNRQSSGPQPGLFSSDRQFPQGLRSGRSRLALSARVARDIDRRPPVATFTRPRPKVSGVSAHNPSSGYYVVGLPIAIRKGTFRLGRGNEHEKGCHFHTIWRRLVAWQPEKILHPWECRGLVWSPKQPRPSEPRAIILEHQRSVFANTRLPTKYFHESVARGDSDPTSGFTPTTLSPAPGSHSCRVTAHSIAECHLLDCAMW